MYDKLSFVVDQNDLPPQDVSEPKYFLDFNSYPLNDECHVLAQNVSSLHDVKIRLHFQSSVCKELLFNIVLSNYYIHR